MMEGYIMIPSLPSRKNFYVLLSIFAFLLCCVYFFILRSLTMTIPNSARIYETQRSKKTPWIMKPNVWSQHELLVDCKRLIINDSKEVARAREIMEHYPKKPISAGDFIELTKNCESFKNNKGYIPAALSENEKTFPIAYGIAIYKDVEQFERLLRAIYRPQNYYCVHVDLKSPKDFHQAVAGITNCFPNVILASSFVDVIWGSFTVLEAYVICLKDLFNRFKDWKYFINLAGQEFPTKTNNELVMNLRHLNGKSVVERRNMSARHRWQRLKYVYNKTVTTRIRRKPFRYNLNIYKGSVYVVLSRQFVNYSLTDNMAKEFLEWLKDSRHPDETFFNTLIENIPVDNPLYTVELKRPTWILVRWVRWIVAGKGPACYGKVVQNVCIFGIGDLKSLTHATRHLFINKFHLDFEYLTLDCWEQWVYNKTYDFYRNSHVRPTQNTNPVNGTGIKK